MGEKKETKKKQNEICCTRQYIQPENTNIAKEILFFKFTQLCKDVNDLEWVSLRRL